MTGTRSATPPGTTGNAWWQGGLTEDQNTTGAPPEWARFTEAVLAAAPVAPARPVGELSGTAGFARVLAPFTELATARLTAGAELAGLGERADRAALAAGFADRLARRLVRTAARTLVLELNVGRVTGQLVGASPTERFADFVRQTSSRAGLARLFAEYPVLARLLALSCLHAVAATAELLGRLAADRELLVHRLWAGADPGALVALDQAAGDGHRHGRSVAVLRFAGGARVVHKPRPVDAHRHFNELAHWFNARLGDPAVDTVTVLARPGYGWVEHVVPEPCGSDAQLARFYRRQGALLALLHAVDGTDVHHENLIARGDRPTLIDVETLFHPPATTFAPGTAGPPDPAGLVLAASVRRTGLLPHLRLGEDGGWDESGLGGDKGVPLPVEAVEFEDSGTDRMRLVRRAPTAAGAANRPTRHGRDADPAAHTEQLLAGFRAGYDAIAAGAADLLGPGGPLRRFAADEVRVVVRPSRGYARLLDESTHPDVLRSAGDRDGLLGLLREEAVGGRWAARLAADEVAQLWTGDVPLFSTRPDSADLWGSGAGAGPGAPGEPGEPLGGMPGEPLAGVLGGMPGEPLTGVLGEPGLDRAAARIRAMGAADRRRQEWIVRAAMATRTVGVTGAPLRPTAGRPAGGGPTPDRALQAARQIGDRLLDAAHHGPDRTNWLGLELIDQRFWQLGPLGAGLADGYLGTALFLAQLARISGEERYARTARQALTPVPALLAGLAAQPEQLGFVGTGAFTGLGGIAYALTQLAAELADPGLAALVEPAVALAAAAVAEDREATLFSGLAGGLAALLAVHRATGSARAQDAARACADRLLTVPLPAGPGFAFGRAGIGWALLAFAADGGGARFARAGLDALGPVRLGVGDGSSDGAPAGPGASDGGASDGGASDEDSPDGGSTGGDASWCRGAAGTALAFADSPAALAAPGRLRDLDRTVRALAAGAPRSDHSLCHGGFGVLELLAAVRDPDPASGAAAAVRAARDLALSAGADPRCGTPGAVSSPGLLTGLAGIGHGLLRLGFPDRVPALLLLRPPVAG
ncbi:type 2 lanthipeptide synthetase LanM family protein [Kitasatospora sp. NPDC058965]|uniref:type 2 lanthipeptide synthetase LanM family protein n=1 Tax=Kitasatospora sp. NPDC058965 TaxID=3346682 RepID=UPI0036BED15F